MAWTALYNRSNCNTYRCFGLDWDVLVGTGCDGRLLAEDAGLTLSLERQPVVSDRAAAVCAVACGVAIPCAVIVVGWLVDALMSSRS